MKKNYGFRKMYVFLFEKKCFSVKKNIYVGTSKNMIYLPKKYFYILDIFFSQCRNKRVKLQHPNHLIARSVIKAVVQLV